MATAVAQERLVEVEAAVVADRCPVGQEKTFRPYDPDQVLLIAPVLSEWIPEGDLAHFVSGLVESGTMICRRSMTPMRRSGVIRRMTRG